MADAVHSTTAPVILEPDAAFTAITHAAHFAEVTFGWLAHTLKFEDRVPPALTEEKVEQIYWAMCRLAQATAEAKRAYYHECDTAP